MPANLLDLGLLDLKASLAKSLALSCEHPGGDPTRQGSQSEQHAKYVQRFAPVGIDFKQQAACDQTSQYPSLTEAASSRKKTRL
jgi:hypothetical protein